MRASRYPLANFVKNSKVGSARSYELNEMGGVGHEDYYPRLCDCSRRRCDDRFGLWELYVLIRERRLRNYIPTVLTIAVGLVLIGLAQALRLLLVLVGYQ